MRGFVLVTAAIVGLAAGTARADLDMSGWALQTSQTGHIWSPTGSGYGADGYGAGSDTGHWGQASGGYDYSINQLSVWTNGTMVRVAAVTGMRFRGNSNFIMGDVGIDTNGDGVYDAALRRPDITHNASTTDFGYVDNANSDTLLLKGLDSGDWVDVFYSQFPTGPFGVDESALSASNAWGVTEVTFDYDYRVGGAPDPQFYSAVPGDKATIVDNADYIYAWTFDTAALAGGFNWTSMGMAVECGNDGIELVNPIPAPGAALLGMLGLSMVGWIRRQQA